MKRKDYEFSSQLTIQEVQRIRAFKAKVLVGLAIGVLGVTLSFLVVSFMRMYL